MKLTKSIVAIAMMATALTAWSQGDIKNTEFNPVTTGVTSLSITPDARGASMGDLGAATEADENSQFWNPSKYAFAYSNAGVSLSYTPWLRKIVNDIYLANLSGYYKLGGGDNHAVSASLRYFSLGEVNTYEGESMLSTINPFEMSVDVGYSRKLSEKYSMGVVLRYIYSDLGYSDMNTGDLSSSASAFSADLSGYYTTFPVIGRNECQWSLGFNLSNIGSKVSYNKGNDPAYLPANLRIGTAFTFPLAEGNNLTLALDANRILVPAKPRLEDYDGDNYEWEQAVEDWKNKSSISGIFDSFKDDFVKRITYSLGAEYSYDEKFFLRGGYYYESKFAGNRQYFGLGAGFKLQVIKIDASYMIATAQNSPLDQTLRFTLSFDMDGIKDLFGRN
jgi:hypothetical protein